MKKIVMLVLGLLIISCSNDESPKETELVSITTNYYADNEIWDSSKYNYLNKKLQDVQNLDQSHTDYKYNNNLIATASNYEPDGVLFSTNNYTFDSNDRLVEFDIVYNTGDVTKYIITYKENSILLTYNNYNGNSLVYEFDLNSDKQIISKKTVSVNGAAPKANSLKYQYIYSNGNLISATSFNPETNITTTLVTYTYSNAENGKYSDKYMYGKAWKINSFLMTVIYQGNYSPVVSENLVSSYKDGSRNITIDYEFNNGKISKMTSQYMTSWNVAMKVESIYEYK